MVASARTNVELASAVAKALGHLSKAGVEVPRWTTRSIPPSPHPLPGHRPVGDSGGPGRRGVQLQAISRQLERALAVGADAVGREVELDVMDDHARRFIDRIGSAISNHVGEDAAGLRRRRVRAVGPARAVAAADHRAHLPGRGVGDVPARVGAEVGVGPFAAISHGLRRRDQPPGADELGRHMLGRGMLGRGGEEKGEHHCAAGT